MKHEDNSIHIGNKAKISNSIIGSKNQNIQQKPANSKESTHKIVWNIIVPIAVIVIAAVICAYLGIPAV